MTKPRSLRYSLGRTVAVGALVVAASALPPMLGAQVPNARQPVVKPPPTERVPAGRGVPAAGTMTPPPPRKTIPRVIGTFSRKVSKAPTAETTRVARQKATTAPAATKKSKTTPKKKKKGGSTHPKATPHLPDTKPDSTRRV